MSERLSFQLLRCALLAKLADDLDDQPLLRRAALEAVSLARQLAGATTAMDAPAVAESTPLPDLERLLREAYPRLTHGDDEEDRPDKISTEAPARTRNPSLLSTPFSTGSSEPSVPVGGAS